jgi:hypothetical protein
MLTKADVVKARETVNRRYPNVSVAVHELWTHGKGVPQYRVSLVDLDADPSCSAHQGRDLLTTTEFAMRNWKRDHE